MPRHFCNTPDAITTETGSAANAREAIATPNKTKIVENL
jgi:hypothetical protein